MRLFYFVLTLCCLTLWMNGTLSAQRNYSAAVGLRLGTPMSVTFKTFFSESLAVEANLGYRSRNLGLVDFRLNQISVGALVEHHSSLDELTDGLSWYVGGGAGVYVFSVVDDLYRESATRLGIQNVLGLDYTFDDIPLNVSFDALPTYMIGTYFSLTTDSNFEFYYGLSARYVLGGQ